ncbi:MAG TPA: hypothetical protein VF458_11015, partial [Ktedonobacteraceae bacterium]
PLHQFPALFNTTQGVLILINACAILHFQAWKIYLKKGQRKRLFFCLNKKQARPDAVRHSSHCQNMI